MIDLKDLNNLSSSDYIESKRYELLDKTDWTKEAAVRVVETIAKSKASSPWARMKANASCIPNG